MRSVLSDWTGLNIDNWNAASIAQKYPNCECEGARPISGGHGPVEDDELIRIFIVSRFNYDLKDKRPKVTQAIFNNVFKRGASAYRLSKASREELELSASILYDEALKNDPQYGGIIGVLDFEAVKVRFSEENSLNRLLCVLETPLDRRYLHCDLVSSVPEPEDKTAFKARLFNQVKANNFVLAKDVADCDLVRFKPAA